jgi:hypothetical protein
MSVRIAIRGNMQVGQAVEDWEAQALNESQDSAHLLRQRREVTPPDRLDASMDGYLVRFEDGSRAELDATARRSGKSSQASW